MLAVSLPSRLPTNESCGRTGSKAVQGASAGHR